MVIRKTLRKARRQQIPHGRPLYALAEERFLSEEYDRFLRFCKDRYSSLDESNLVSQATFEHLVEEFEEGNEGG